LKYQRHKENFFDTISVISLLMGEKMIVKKAMNVAVNVGGNENASLPKRS
jgi:hypothetical protein